MSVLRTVARSLITARVALLLSLLATILAAKLQLIDRYASDLPFWDQWDAEGHHVLAPHLEGHLTAADLFRPHNEHRPLLTRLWGLGLFELGGQQWDARVQVIANSILHLGVAALLFGLAWRALPPRATAAFAVLAALFFAMSVSWENTLAGFQSQFYFVLLFSALHVGGTLLAPARSWRWWLAPLAGVAALFSMASGLLSALAVLGALAARALRDRRIAREDVLMAMVNVGLVVAGLLLKTTVPDHAVLMASKPGPWLDAFVHQFSWPVISLWAAPLGMLPPAALAWAYFRRQVDGPVALTLLGAVTWFCLQAAAIAYARGAESHGYASRYCDTLAVGVLVNALALGYLTVSAKSARTRWIWAACTAIFVVVAVAGLSRETKKTADETLRILPDVNAARVANVREYLATRDPAFFKKSPWDELPYPEASLLAGYLDTPVIRRVLPASVRPLLVPSADAPATQEFAAQPPATLAAPGLPTWSSTPGQKARFVSAPLAIDHNRVTLQVAADGSGANRLELVDERGRRFAPLGALSDGPRWKRVNFAVTPGRYRLEAAHDGAGWLAFTALTTTTPLSNVALKFPSFAGWFFGAAAVAAVFALWRLRGPRNAEIAPRRDYFSAGVALVFAGSLAAILIGRLGHAGIELRENPVTDARPVTDFNLLDPSSGQPNSRYVGAAFVVRGPRAAWFGTYVDGDAFTGRVASTPFRLDGATLHVPIAGYPASPGNALTLEILDAAGRPEKSVRFVGANPRETPGVWHVAIEAWRGRLGRLVLSDGETQPGGWLAVGTPLGNSRTGAELLYGVPRNYGWYFIGAIACGALLFVPGLSLRTWQPARFHLEPALLPLPGLFALALLGALTWWGGADMWRMPADLLLGLLAGVACFLADRWWHEGGPLRRDECMALGVYASAVVAALAFGVLPLEVAQESDLHSSAQARMIASPPDNAIPYRTAVYLLYGKDGRADSAAYFGEGWSITSRGPLAPLMIAGALEVFDARPGDPPQLHVERWPVSADAYFIARILGILTNALVILGGAALAARLVPGSERVALVWLAVAPVVIINTDFVWPKLLATFFALLAVRAVVTRESLVRAAGWGALAYFSHPVGGLMMPPLAAFVACRAWQSAASGTVMRTVLVRVGTFGLVLFICVAPWLALKAVLGYHDVFLDYPLGDGRGPTRAASLLSWLACRWDNFRFTLAPGAFHFSRHMTEWLDGPLSASLRWGIGYAKTLPGALGLGGYAVAVWALCRRTSPAPRGFRRCLVFGSFALLLLFWGYSTDGLGRNCLEPLAILVLVFTAAAIPPSAAAWSWVLPLACLEALSVRVLGVVAAPAFSTETVNLEVMALALLAAGAAVLPIIVWFRTARAARAPRLALPDVDAVIAPGAARRWLIFAGMVLLFGALLFLRKPDALLNPQLWAEDGTVFLNQNEEFGIAAWWHPYAGYLHLVPRLVAAVGARLDPCDLPAFYNLTCFIGTWAVAVSLLSRRVAVPGRFWLALAFVLVPHTGEVFFQLCNVQWVLALFLVRQLLLEPAATRTQLVADSTVLALVSFTGPFCIVLWPLFAWRTWRHRTQRATWVELGIVTVAAMAHVIANRIAPFDHPPANGGLDPLQIAAFVGQRISGVLLLGWGGAATLGFGVRVGFGCALALTVVALVYGSRRSVVAPAIVVLVVAAGLLLGSTLIRGGRGFYTEPQLEMGDRYLFLPRVLLCWTAIAATAGLARAKWLPGVLMTAAIAVNVPHFVVPTAIDYRWHDYCHLLKDGHPAEIPTLPKGWILHYYGKGATR
jgi:hypothetical protein